MKDENWKPIGSISLQIVEKLARDFFERQCEKDGVKLEGKADGQNKASA